MSAWQMRLKSESFQKVLWPLVALGVILLFNLLFTPGFFRVELKTHFTLTEQSLDKLREEQIPDEVLAKLEDLKDEEYAGEAKFISAVQEVLGEEPARYRTMLLRHAHREKRLFGSLIDILNRGAPTMLLTIGMTLVFATGGIDLSVGSVLAISGAMAAHLIRPGYAQGILEYPDPPTSIILAVVLPLLLAMAAGAWNGFLVAYVGVQPIIATLILMVAGRGIAQLITRGQIVIFIHEQFEYVGGGFFLGLPFPVIIVIIMLTIVYLLTRKTALGMFIEAVGANPTASRFMGLRARQIKLALYTISALCSGIAGLIVCSDIRGADGNNAGLFLELDAIASVIIGGTMWGGRFTMAGSMFGALIMQALTTTILTRGVPPEVTLVYKAIVIILVALLQSENFRQLLTTYLAFMKGKQA